MAWIENSDTGLWMNPETGQTSRFNPEILGPLGDQVLAAIGPKYAEWVKWRTDLAELAGKIDTPEKLAYLKDTFKSAAHPEDLSYQLAGFSDPKALAAWKKEKSGAVMTPIEAMVSDNPGMVGQSVVRPDIPDVMQGVADPSAADNVAYTQELYDKYGVTSKDYSDAATSWAASNTAAAQAARDTDGFDGLLPLIVLAGVGIATGGFGLLGGTAGAEAGALAATDAMAGIGAAEAAGIGSVAAGAAGSAEALAAADTVAGLAPAAAETASGSGIMSGIAKGAVRGAVTSTLTGGDPIKGALSGGITGGIMSGIGTVDTGLSDTANTAANAAIKGAVGGAVSTAINGGGFGDVLENAAIGGVVGGAGSFVQGTVKDALTPPTGATDDQYVSVDTATNTDRFDYINTVANAAGGAAAGATGAALTGGDVGNAILTGGISGGASGLATDNGASPVVAGAIGTVAGAIVNDAVATQPGSAQDTTATPPATPDVATVSWGDFVGPEFVDVGRRNMAWGTRLSGRAA